MFQDKWFCSRTNAFRTVKQALRFGRLSRSSSIEDDQKSLMGLSSGGHRSSGMEDSTDNLSSDCEAAYNDFEDDLDGNEAEENEKAPDEKQKRYKKPKPPR